MPRFVLLVAFACIVIPSVAIADLPPPTGTKYFDPRVRFVGIEKNANYVFFLNYVTGQDQRFMAPFGLQVKSDAEFTLKGTSRFIGGVQLSALPRQDFEKMKNGNPPREIVDAKTPGALTVSIAAPNNVGSKFNVRGPLTEYRVTIKDGKLAVETSTKRSDAGPMPGWAVGVALALSLAGFGVWIARRRS